MADALLDVPSPACDAVLAADKPSPECGGPCATCAFRPGTEANRSAHTMVLARLCVEGLRYFHCHERPHFCRGWMAAVNLRGLPTTQAERDRCEVAGAAADAANDLIEQAVQRERAAGILPPDGINWAEKRQQAKGAAG